MYTGDTSEKVSSSLLIQTTEDAVYSFRSCMDVLYLLLAEQAYVIPWKLRNFAHSTVQL